MHRFAVFSIVYVAAACAPAPAPRPSPVTAAAPEPSASTAAPVAMADDPGDVDATLEPEVRRDAALDHCFWGMLEARLARDAYLAKLGPGEPNARTVPVLLQGQGRPFSFQKAASWCDAAAAAAREVPDGTAEVAAALAPLATAMSDTLVQLFACFDTGCGKTDGFSRLRTMTERLQRGQGDFDTRHDRLGALVATRPSARSKRATGLLGEAELTALHEHARDFAAVVLVAKSSEPGDRKARLEALERDAEALRAAGAKGKTPIVTIVAQAADRFVAAAKALDASAQPVDPAAKVELVDAFEALGTARLRALSVAIKKGGARVAPGP